MFWTWGFFDLTRCFCWLHSQISAAATIFFAKVDCIGCALRIESVAIYLIEKLNNIKNALNVLKPDMMGQIGQKVVIRIFLWEHAETDSIKDGQNKKKHVTPMPRARPKNVHAKPLKPRPQPINTCAAAVARVYYAMFHAATAVLAAKGVKRSVL